MAQFQCKVDIPAGPGLKDDQLTVGREFFLNCQGEFPKDLKTENLQFVLEAQNKYALKLLGFEFRSPTEADIKVTSYTAAQVNIPNLQLTDGQQTLELGQIQFALVSVLPQQPAAASPGQEVKPPQPFGPMGPASIPVPSLYWSLLASVLGILVLMISYKVFRLVQRRKLLNRLKEHDSAQSPGSEFYAHIRQLQRRNTVFFGGKAEAAHIPEAVDQLQGYFKKYLTRKFQVPALDWPSRLVLKDLKKYHRKTYTEFGIEIKKMLHEFSQAQKDREKLTETDALKISSQSQGLVDKLERAVR